MRPAPLALPLLFVAFCAVRAATPEEEYISARDDAIAKVKKFEAKNPSADPGKIENKALAELNGRLQAMIGPLSAKPYPATGKIALETLSENNVGFGALDALRFAEDGGGAQAADGPQVYVTTDGLFSHWVSKPQEWWTKTRKTPPGFEEALANPEFYTFALGLDAALDKTIDLPIKKPAGVTYAYAALGGWAQDVGPHPEQDIIVALRRDGKVYIAREAAKKFSPIPACEAIWTAAERKVEAAVEESAKASAAKSAQIAKETEAVQQKADKDYHACYAERTPKAAFFPALANEAQAIADRFAGQ
jgi:hypothetical protein